MRHLRIARYRVAFRAYARCSGLGELLLGKGLRDAWKDSVVPGWQLTISRCEKDRQTGPQGSNLTGELKTRHTRHHVICDNQIDRGHARSENVQGALTRGCTEHFVTEILEHLGRAAKNQVIVIDQ